MKRIIKECFEEWGALILCIVYWLILIAILVFFIGCLVSCYDLRSMWKDCKITQARDFYQEKFYLPDRYVIKGICKVEEFEVR